MLHWHFSHHDFCSLCKSGLGRDTTWAIFSAEGDSHRVISSPGEGLCVVSLWVVSSAGEGLYRLYPVLGRDFVWVISSLGKDCMGYIRSWGGSLCALFLVWGGILCG